MIHHLDFPILSQPDDSTCGPTCLHAVYRFFGDHLPLERVIREAEALDNRGTLAVLLALHAMQRGYRATIYTYNLHVFDPTWFTTPSVDLAGKLRAQMGVKGDPRLAFVTEAYLRYLELGGRIRFRELTPELVRKYLKRGLPILTGLSATYLYQSSREVDGEPMVLDDVRGEPTGHFVVLSGYDPDSREVQVADPLGENPPYGRPIYRVPIQRVLGAVLLGILTHDANLLVLEPAEPPGRQA